MSVQHCKTRLPNIIEETFFPWTTLLFDGLPDRRQRVTTSGDFSLSEDETHIYFEADVPGVAPKDIAVTFEKGVLWVKAERCDKSSDEKTHYFKRTASFAYQAPIPSSVDSTSEPQATYKDGVIRIVFEKKRKEQPKKINVREG